MKDVITVYIDKDNNYTTSIMVGKIVKMTPSGTAEWTTIELVGGSTKIVHHTVNELTALIEAKS